MLERNIYQRAVTSLCLVVVVLVTLETLSLTAQSVSPPLKAARVSDDAIGTNAWNTLCANIVIRRSRVDAEGKPLPGLIPTVTYRFERTRSGQHWKTTLTLVDVAPTGASRPRSATTAAPAFRFEDDGDGTPP